MHTCTQRTCACLTVSAYPNARIALLDPSGAHVTTPPDFVRARSLLTLGGEDALHHTLDIISMVLVQGTEQYRRMK
jgi:hypothetical protein